MSWWQRLWHKRSTPLLPERLRLVNLAMDGWTEETPTGEMRTWRNSDGNVLCLATAGGSLELPPVSDIDGLRRWCRALAESGDAGLIDMKLDSADIGGTVGFIYKRLQGHAYVFTGMLFVAGDDETLTWTVVSGEVGMTGVREAVITAQLMEAGQLTIEDYQRSWAQDPYDPPCHRVERRVLRFVSDDQRFDPQFPHHPLSKVRHVLATLPRAMRIEVDARPSD